MLEPCYDSYVPAIVLSGGVPIAVPLRYPDYSVDWDRGAARRSPPDAAAADQHAAQPDRRGALAPPTCARWPRSSRARTCSCSATRCTSTSSSTACAHESLAGHDALAARSFVVGSFGKTYHATGWKVGYAAAPAALTAELRKVHQFVTFSTSTPVQHAIAEFLAAERGLRRNGAVLPGQARPFLELMEGSRFVPLPSHGSYFQLMDYSAISDEPDADFAVRLTREHGVAAIPTSPFLTTRRRRTCCGSASRRRMRRWRRGGALCAPC